MCRVGTCCKKVWSNVLHEELASSCVGLNRWNSCAAVNAEEGIGVSAALDTYNSLKGEPKYPSAAALFSMLHLRQTRLLTVVAAPDWMHCNSLCVMLLQECPRFPTHSCEALLTCCTHPLSRSPPAIGWTIQQLRPQTLTHR